MKLILILITLISLSRSENLDIEKLENAKLISQVTKNIGLENAKKYTKTLVMISYQESDLGDVMIGDHKNGEPLKKASVGMFHMRVVTVRELQRFFPERLGWLKNVSDDWIANTLLKSKQFSIVLASYNLERIAIKSKGNYLKLVSQWNGGFNNKSYYNAVLKHKYKAEEILNIVRS